LGLGTYNTFEEAGERCDAGHAFLGESQNLPRWFVDRLQPLASTESTSNTGPVSKHVCSTPLQVRDATIVTSVTLAGCRGLVSRS
jgi:hypothetical protein